MQSHYIRMLELTNSGCFLKKAHFVHLRHLSVCKYNMSTQYEAERSYYIPIHSLNKYSVTVSASQMVSYRWWVYA